MRRFSFAAVLLAAAGLAAIGLAGAAHAQPADRPTPKNWNWEIKDGKRVPRAHRVANPDGSWREEVRQGNCVTVREKSAAGEYKEVRRCG